MPLYEDRRNAENHIAVSPECFDAVAVGNESVFKVLLEAVRKVRLKKGAPVILALDGWYGVEWEQILNNLQSADTSCEIGQYLPAHELFKTREERAAYKQPYLTEDPAFGYVNTDGRVEDLIDQDKAELLKIRLTQCEESVVLYGSGAATKLLDGYVDLRAYFDKTRQPMLWQMWDGALVPFGESKPDPSYGWKEYYYNDYHMLDHQKEYLYDMMDFWVEAIHPDELKLMPRKAYHELIQTMVKYPVKEIKIYQPGPWGAYRYRDLFEVPGLECNAWNELAGPELGMIVELNGAKTLEMPMLNLMQYQAEYLGEYIAKHYPRLFPLDVWLDDGYFPEKQPIERTAMPIHTHPSTSYINNHFNEPLGRYETYYICEAYQGACTILGYKDDVDLEQWENSCRESQNITPIDDWENYFSIWDSNVGDLYLIPPGTAHGHGGNQMVLEMDTCPSIAATEYSFFEYDFARNSWDDRSKTMTAPPMKMHPDHAFDTEKWRRESWVKDHLLAKPVVEKWTKDYQLDRYTSVKEMPFDVERLHFYQKAQHTTEGKFAQVLTVTIGSGVIVRSLENSAYSTELELFQSAIIPACFGAYEVLSKDGGFTETVVLRWKKG